MLISKDHKLRFSLPVVVLYANIERLRSCNPPQTYNSPLSWGRKRGIGQSRKCQLFLCPQALCDGRSAFPPGRKSTISTCRSVGFCWKSGSLAAKPTINATQTSVAASGSTRSDQPKSSPWIRHAQGKTGRCRSAAWRGSPTEAPRPARGAPVGPVRARALSTLCAHVQEQLADR